MEQKMIHPQKGKLAKRILLVVASLVVVAGIAFGTITLLSRYFPKKTTEQAVTLTPEQKAAKQAVEDLNAGKKSEDAGETAAAIASYKEALAQYQAAGDKAGEAGVQLKLQYLESLPQ